MINNIDMLDVKNTFNRIKVAKGQTVSVATVGADGTPNVAPIGSMRMVDGQTVHLLQGFLPRTTKNLENNPMATFMVTHQPGLRDFFQLFSQQEEDIMGYRILAELVEKTDSQDAVLHEIEMIRKRVPWILRRGFQKFCQKTIRRVLKFRIKEIRPVS